MNKQIWQEHLGIIILRERLKSLRNSAETKLKQLFIKYMIMSTSAPYLIASKTYTNKA